ncbi:hypothetical protein [Prosthecobacter vanneervenii]|uniref:Uncharacterized protein n=1 Tax=Prosthecobacter vanneervenii TaxID=48466 RepID=A0A7W7Y6E3_9BACT|nr:hypothetical protein [Prosthecobacter vanneervenii]MBB5030451.1 hypothetical protein [Prosthecobacter vanneervenii]
MRRKITTPVRGLDAKRSFSDEVKKRDVCHKTYQIATQSTRRIICLRIKLNLVKISAIGVPVATKSATFRQNLTQKRARREGRDLNKACEMMGIMSEKNSRTPINTFPMLQQSRELNRPT